MQTIAMPWQIVWGLLSAGCVLGGLAVLLKWLYPKPLGTAPHCPACGYNLTGASSEICPECGAPRRERVCRRCRREFGDSAAEICPHCNEPRVVDTAVVGEYRRSSRLAAIAGILMLLGLTSGVTWYRALPRSVRATRTPVSVNVQNARAILASLRQDCVAGQLRPGGGRGVQPAPADNRIGLMALLVHDKVPYVIGKRVTNAAVAQTALTQVKAAGQFIDTQLLPAYNKASVSGNPQDIKALVPLLDQLDKQLNTLLTTLKGY